MVLAIVVCIAIFVIINLVAYAAIIGAVGFFLQITFVVQAFISRTAIFVLIAFFIFAAIIRADFQNAVM